MNVTTIVSRDCLNTPCSPMTFLLDWRDFDRRNDSSRRHLTGPRKQHNSRWIEPSPQLKRDCSWQNESGGWHVYGDNLGDSATCQCTSLTRTAHSWCSAEETSVHSSNSKKWKHASTSWLVDDQAKQYKSACTPLKCQYIESPIVK